MYKYSYSCPEFILSISLDDFILKICNQPTQTYIFLRFCYSLPGFEFQSNAGTQFSLIVGENKQNSHYFSLLSSKVRALSAVNHENQVRIITIYIPGIGGRPNYRTERRLVSGDDIIFLLGKEIKYSSQILYYSVQSCTWADNFIIYHYYFLSHLNS